MEERNRSSTTRRPDVDGFSVPLADGQAWFLATPSKRLRLKGLRGVDALGRATTTFNVEGAVGYPIEIRRLIGDLRSACESAGPESHYDALIRLASALLRRAHEVDSIEAAALFDLELDRLPGLVESILRVVTGQCHPSQA